MVRKFEDDLPKLNSLVLGLSWGVEKLLGPTMHSRRMSFGFIKHIDAHFKLKVCRADDSHCETAVLNMPYT